MTTKFLSFVLLFFVLLECGTTYAANWNCSYTDNNNMQLTLSSVDSIGKEVVLYDFTQDVCEGILHRDYQDALRISSFDELPGLSDAGLKTYFKVGGVYYSASEALGRCIWPTTGATCPATDGTINSVRHNMVGEIILRRVDGTQNEEANIPANSTILSVELQQRGYYPSAPHSWGGNYFRSSYRNTDALEFPTCSIEASSLDLSVTLSPVSKSVFTGIGSTAGQVPFQYRLNCDSGVTVNLTVEDSSDLSNTGNIFSLQRDATATGVGIQMLHDGTPVSFKESKTLVSSAVQGMNIIDFDARYIKIADDVQPGSVIAKAIISFDYL